MLIVISKSLVVRVIVQISPTHPLQSAKENGNLEGEGVEIRNLAACGESVRNNLNGDAMLLDDFVSNFVRCDIVSM